MYIRDANRNTANKKENKEKEWSEQTYKVIVGKEIKVASFHQ